MTASVGTQTMMVGHIVAVSDLGAYSFFLCLFWLTDWMEQRCPGWHFLTPTKKVVGTIALVLLLPGFLLLFPMDKLAPNAKQPLVGAMWTAVALFNAALWGLAADLVFGWMS